MKTTPRTPLLILLAAMLAGGTSWTAAQEHATATQPAPISSSKAASSNSTKPTIVQPSAADRLEGERRFKANCGRCHQAPHKFPPRMMATIVRHMRVRATITDDDMRLILQYMTQ